MTKEDILEQRRILKKARYTRYSRNLTLWALIAEIFLLPLSPPLATIAMLLGAVGLLARRRFDEDFRFRALPLDLPAILFVLLAAASILVAPDKAFSFYNYYNLVGAYVLTYILAGQVLRTPRELRLVLGALAASTVLVVLYGFWQFTFGIDTADMKWVDGDAFPELRRRVFSTWENPNILAGFLDAAICLVFAFFVKADTRRKRVALGVFFLALLACLAMTYARGAMLVIAVIVAVYGLLRDWRVLVAFLVLGGLLLLVDPVLTDRLLSIFTKMDTSTEMRLAFWESTIQMIQDHPFLGIGWGMFFKVYPEYDFYLQGADVLIVHAHNIYLNYMAEIGLAGAIAFFWFFFGSLVELCRMRFAFPAEEQALEPQAEEPQDIAEELEEDVEDAIHVQAIFQDLLSWSDSRFFAGLRLGLALVLVSVALNGITDDLLFNIPTSMLLWFFLAVTGVLQTYAVEEEEMAENMQETAEEETTEKEAEPASEETKKDGDADEASKAGEDTAAADAPKEPEKSEGAGKTETAEKAVLVKEKKPEEKQSQKDGGSGKEPSKGAQKATAEEKAAAPQKSSKAKTISKDVEQLKKSGQSQQPKAKENPKGKKKKAKRRESPQKQDGKTKGKDVDREVSGSHLKGDD